MRRGLAAQDWIRRSEALDIRILSSRAIGRAQKKRDGKIPFLFAREGRDKIKRVRIEPAICGSFQKQVVSEREKGEMR